MDAPEQGGSGTGFFTKAALVVGTGAAIGAGAYLLYRHFDKKRLEYNFKDEGFEDLSKVRKSKIGRQACIPSPDQD